MLQAAMGRRRGRIAPGRVNAVKALRKSAMKPFMFSASILAAAASTAAAQSCRQTAGPQRSQEMVRQCTEVSPATHPPCNASNPCDLIVDEIRSGCARLAEPDAGIRPPAFCGRYR